MSSMYDRVSEFRSDMPVEAQLIQKVNELLDRIEQLEKTNKAFRDNVTFDIEGITRRISSQPVATKANSWADLEKAGRANTPYYLKTATI